MSPTLTPEQVAFIHGTEIVYGPFIVGLFINLILYGVACTQYHFYIVSFPKDRVWIKIYLASLFLTSTANSILIMYVAYVDLIKHFGLDIVSGAINKAFPVNSCMTGVIAAQSQLFYSWRLHKLAKNWFITILTMALALLSLAGAFGIGVILGSISAYGESYKYKTYAIIWLVSATVCDILISIVLVLLLRSKKSGIRATDDTIDMIISLTVRTGLVTALTAIFELIAYLGFTTNGAHLAFGLILAKLYVNMVLSSLNSRRTMGTSSERGQGGPDAFSLSNVNTRVFVTVESHRQRDRDGDAVHDDSADHDDSKVPHSSLTAIPPRPRLGQPEKAAGPDASETSL
ncbi:hypothetical protein EXIGLDRAFT_760543 [Exidia glandulosa HHB12029]|uniref:DUF6534 domain-containing protein n=1 Tax=Exidia glandulosa HHB12029 TaxID=1314781 RepID=A0A165P443_EXIGL|nr:hypothetical protein EXIGLDRAFT_760543 [Exidia glandulosa HHB12029]